VNNALEKTGRNRSWPISWYYTSTWVDICYKYPESGPRFTGGPAKEKGGFFLSITNNMQRYTIFFITVNVLYVSGGFSAHHQEFKNCTHSIGYMSSLLAATVSVGEWVRNRLKDVEH